jgi:hypothetical protein
VRRVLGGTSRLFKVLTPSIITTTTLAVERPATTAARMK